jgi:predicted nucleic acid-binding protein
VIFVDTGVWFASGTPADRDYAAARQLLATAAEPLVTTDYVIDEALTLLTVRNRRAPAIDFGNQIFGGMRGHIYYVSEADVRAAWNLFQRFQDKDWSFTDCTSYVVMQRLGIATAFSFDHHFRQFGTVAVVP